MTGLRNALLVARWEFARFIKWKQQLVGLFITLIALAAVTGVQELARRSQGDGARIAVVGAERLPVDAAGEETIRLERHAPAALDSLRDALARRKIRGLLVIHTPDSAELFVGREPGWRPALERSLARARQQQRLAEANMSAAELAALFAPPRLEVRYDESSARTRNTRRWAIGAVVFMLLALFTGTANTFVSITGEKQLRVTEQVVSAIPAQSWIDGKILGITGVAIVGALNTGLVIVAFMLWRSGGVAGFGSAAPSWTLVLVFALLALLGSLFWLSLFGAIAATIDDPNSSMRSTFLFLPMLFSAPATAIVANPDTAFARALSIFPLTSPTALPVRMLQGATPWWEVVLSIALLAAATWWMRGIAGRVFRFGMLMHGKEPSWHEMRKWARRA